MRVFGESVETYYKLLRIHSKHARVSTSLLFDKPTVGHVDHTVRNEYDSGRNSTDSELTIKLIAKKFVQGFPATWSDGEMC